jgi:hypothetical protein
MPFVSPILPKYQWADYGVAGGLVQGSIEAGTAGYRARWFIYHIVDEYEVIGSEDGDGSGIGDSSSPTYGDGGKA